MAHSLRCYGDAAFRRGEIFACDVEKDCAAGAGNCGAEIVIEDDDDIVKVIGPPEAFVACRIGQADRLVVGAVGRIVAPAGVRIDGGDRERGSRALYAVGTIEDGDEAEAASGCRAVALAFPLADTGATQSTTGSEAAGEDHAAPPVSRCWDDDDFRKDGSGGHARIVFPGRRQPQRALALRRRPVAVYT